jgi:hypothetical protein
MDPLVRSLIWKHYNRAKAAARRGQLEEGRVNRALGLCLRANYKPPEEYHTSIHSCDCPDELARALVCKHRIWAMIWQRVAEDLIKIFEGII